MTVVVNAGPLSALGKLNLVHLLSRLYGRVLVPSAVYEEVVTRGLDLGEADAYAVHLAITRRELSVIAAGTTDLPDTGSDSPLQVGELQAIALARQEAADWVLLDDYLAREYANRLGLRVKGTLGVLVAAHREGLMTSEEVELTFQAILDRDDIWIGEDLVRRVQDAWRRERA